jgi:hypothetical protein
MNKHQRVPAICVVCGQAFGARAADTRRGYGRYCSQSCRNRGRARKPHSHPVLEVAHPLGRAGEGF